MSWLRTIWQWFTALFRQPEFSRPDPPPRYKPITYNLSFRKPQLIGAIKRGCRIIAFENKSLARRTNGNGTNTIFHYKAMKL